jgi:high-affinity iron transporter
MFLIIAAPFLASLFAPPANVPPDQGDQTTAVRRIAATTALAAQEYGIGVHAGRVVAPEEIEEARLFLGEARRTASLLPAETARPTIAGLDSLLAMVARTAPADSLLLHSRRLAEALAARLGVSLDEVPSRQPLVARGADIYQTRCVGCHGAAGRGDGPTGLALAPPPADLSDFSRLASVTPLDYYRRTTIGVAGTAMPAFESSLSADERWAVALYATLLRLPAPRGEVPTGLREFSATARMSDLELATALGAGKEPASVDARARIAAVRSYGTTETRPDDAAVVFNAVRSQLDSALAQAALNQGERASSTAFDAYMAFEQVELGVRAKNPGLANALEAGFAALRTRAAGGATPAELREIQVKLLADLENAERTIGDRLSPLNLFFQSFVLLLREGLEAILVVGALMAFLLRTGAGHRRRDIHVGVAAAVAASLLTALLLETLFQVSRASQEALEGGVMLVATAMLFYVSYWLLSKMEVAKWNRFVKGRVQDAVSSGSALALASVAFLAVYREGFETVLFYKALFLTGAGSVLPVLVGMVAGGLALAMVYYAINRWGVKIPLKPFFGFTSAFLYYMAFVFAGKGIAELQEGGLIGTTVLPWAPRIPALGIYPTAESLALQAVLLLLFLAGLAWSFVIEPRRLAVTNVLVPEPATLDAANVDQPLAAPLTVPTERPLRLEVDMLRSLDRMDADLAALRAEVERLKGMLQRSAPRRR